MQARLNLVPTRTEYYTEQSSHAAYKHKRNVGEFSVNEDRLVLLDSSQARSVWLPYLAPDAEIHFDCEYGQDKFTPWPLYKEERLDIVSQFLMKTVPPQTDLRTHFGENVNVITNRGTLRTICRIPYLRRPRKFVATKRNGVIFIYQKSYEPVRRSGLTEEMHRWFDYLDFEGPKFEHLITVGEGQDKPEMDQEFSNCAEFRVVSLAQLHRDPHRPYKILMSSQIDSVDENGELIEISKVNGRLDEEFWRKKSLNFYLQLKLSGVDKMVIGFGPKEIVDEIKVLTVKDFERKGAAFWDQRVCFDFLNNVLATIDLQIRNGETCLVEFPGSKRDVEVKIVDGAQFPVLNQEFLQYLGETSKVPN